MGLLSHEGEGAGGVPGMFSKARSTKSLHPFQPVPGTWPYLSTRDVENAGELMDFDENSTCLCNFSLHFDVLKGDPQKAGGKTLFTNALFDWFHF